MNQPQNSHDMRAGRDGIETDPWLDGLLDEALSADRISIPAGLTDRIVAATEHQLPGRSPVLARIGRYSFVARYAATLLLIASIGITFFVASNISNQRRINDQARAEQMREQAALAKMKQIEDELQRFTHNQPVTNDVPILFANAPVDQSIDQVKARLNSEITTAVDTWDQMTESLEIELARLDTESNG